MTDKPLKVPQIGWNNIYDLKSALFQGLRKTAIVILCMAIMPALGETTIAKTDYMQPYSSALHKKNFYGVQFHPEKSAAVGESILKNFIQL